jgi:hypothetical protein
MEQITPAQAVQNLAAVVDQVALTGPQRRVLEESLRVLHALSRPLEAAPSSPAVEKS